MSRPAPCSAGPVFVTERSAPALTVVVVVAELFPGTLSVVPLDIVAVLRIVAPLGVFALTFTARLKLAMAPAANLAIAHLTLPFPPAAGPVQVAAGPRYSATDPH